DVEVLLAHVLECLPGTGSARRASAALLENARQHRASVLVIVHDEHLRRVQSRKLDGFQRIGGSRGGGELASRIFRPDLRDGQRHDKGASLVFAGTLDPHGTAVKLHESPHDRQPESQPTVAARCRRICLAKSVEYVREELGANADAGILDHDFDVGVHSLQYDLDLALLGSELDGVGKKIPENLLQAIRVAANPSDTGVQELVDADVLGIRALSDRLDGVVDHLMELDGLDFQMDFPGDDPAHIEQVVHDLSLGANVPLDRLEAAVAILG